MNPNIINIMIQQIICVEKAVEFNCCINVDICFLSKFQSISTNIIPLNL